ncbi:DUF86 domain-containing protein [Methanospirillum sp. J.3.6.1-F.2.7.3]|jgi:uncharacterized protein with HEPN domain|uniref:DUF86 domain-containing protein n=2 Tax=Methanospirillum TaxID=2202 RepID=A0A8E7AVY3_9EURY|nr:MULTISPECIES: HepT-like ribonuclease domain-containing protein [Methanospirillum]MDX8551085.1 HepT-like ribonuclease domain-containing protein [Methanospirillum hungatei]NLW76084.1 DUF86 domain-containing protein [Methanomicrobiales archaeon]QVV87745.1 DUF86 domain-containing protein [Methanospirillum sp. J.3.6.1-F.2.7.3]QXO95299.1 DUF86 domain-containing protein [Methanospirillum hungatei]
MDRDLSLLKDIQIMCSDAISFLGNRSREDLMKDRQLQYALIRCLEVIGEAAKLVSSDTKDRYPEIPWSEYAKTRDFLIHSYAKIDTDIIWQSVKNDLPELLRILNNPAR